MSLGTFAHGFPLSSNNKTDKGTFAPFPFVPLFDCIVKCSSHVFGNFFQISDLFSSSTT